MRRSAKKEQEHYVPALFYYFHNLFVVYAEHM